MTTICCKPDSETKHKPRTPGARAGRAMLGGPRVHNPIDISDHGVSSGNLRSKYRHHEWPWTRRAVGLAMSESSERVLTTECNPYIESLPTLIYLFIYVLKLRLQVTIYLGDLGEKSRPENNDRLLRYPSCLFTIQLIIVQSFVWRHIIYH